jgi:hypothetical protein
MPCFARNGRFAIKKNFFALLDKNVIPRNPIKFHLKYIQDCFALAEVVKAVQNRVDTNPSICIGEIGANHSRVLPELTQYTSRLYAIDVYDRSTGGGYITKPENVQYGIIECLVGDSKSFIESHFFDILFSISVVENVPPEMLFDFLLDHDRILKPGGVAIHLVDFYCDKSKSASRIVKSLIDCFKKLDPSFECGIDDWSFRPSFCSNDDYTMWQWNKIAPGLSSVREESQSSTFILKVFKSM